jgi:hypothetical protein
MPTAFLGLAFWHRVRLSCHANLLFLERVLKPTKQEIDRFNSKWIKSGDCHLWTGPKDKDGYGFITFRRTSRRAHRVAMFLAGKPIPSGFVVNHICRHRDCVNPQHLEAISIQENWRKDANTPSYINSQKIHCPRGHEYDRKYGGQRYCSICEAAKNKRLRAKWKAEGIFKI